MGPSGHALAAPRAVLGRVRSLLNRLGAVFGASCALVRAVETEKTQMLKMHALPRQINDCGRLGPP
eukprot:4097453-Pyramimonas_sp.AAC.1